MPVFLDLDNTLVDRDGAFQRWAHRTVPTWGGDLADIEWIIRADANGYTPRDQLAHMIEDRLNPDTCDLDGLVAQLLYEHVEYIECYPGVLSQLEALTAIGEALVIVTNGGSKQQRMKLQRTGLNGVIAGSAISGELGFKKPDARIFEVAEQSQVTTDPLGWLAITSKPT